MNFEELTIAKERVLEDMLEFSVYLFMEAEGDLHYTSYKKGTLEHIRDLVDEITSDMDLAYSYDNNEMIVKAVEKEFTWRHFFGMKEYQMNGDMIGKIAVSEEFRNMFCVEDFWKHDFNPTELERANYLIDWGVDVISKDDEVYYIRDITYLYGDRVLEAYYDDNIKMLVTFKN